MVHADPGTRAERLLSSLDRSRFDGVVVNPGPTMRYLLGVPFHLMERPVLAFFTPGRRPAIALPELEASRVAHLDIAASTYGENPSAWPAAIGSALRAAGLEQGRIAVEPRWLRVLELDFLHEAAPGAQFVAAGDLFDHLRVQKGAEEVASIRKAVRIAESALRSTIPEIRAGVTERQLANILVSNLLAAGADPTLPFAPIVAGGPNAADPHAEPSNRAIKQGDVVLIDWGASSDGYFSDLTRVFCVGQPVDGLEQVADLVYEANAAARNAGGPGVSASSVDRAARDTIAAGGHRNAFTHRTGHGLGLEVHEAPYIRGDNDVPLESGMVFTIEPGVYIPGRFGVRIEDDVLVTDTGLESLSTLDRRMVRVGV